MDLAKLYEKALQLDFLSVEEGVTIFNQAPLAELMFVADQLGKNRFRMEKLPGR